jgi:hypothetical protein
MKTLRRLFRRLTSWATSARDEELLRAEIEEHIVMQGLEPRWGWWLPPDSPV